MMQKKEPPHEQPVPPLNDTLIESSDDDSESVKNPFTDSESDM